LGPRKIKFWVFNTGEFVSDILLAFHGIEV